LTPRLQAGGSMAGAQPAPSLFSPPDYRLYDSIDELAFDPNRVVVTSDATSTPAALYPGTNGADPVGRTTLKGLTAAIIDQRRFFITAHSRAPEETLFGTPRVSLWPLQAQTEARTSKDNLLAFCSTIEGQPYYYQRATYYQYQQDSSSGVISNPSTPSSQSATLDFPDAPTAPGSGAPKTGVQRNEDIYGYLQALTAAPVPGFGGDFLTKYPGANGVTDRDQILTEMFDMLRSGVNTFDLANGIYPRYTYTPFAVSGNNDAGSGTTVPISIPNGTHGLGRNYTIAEVTLVFVASDIDLNDAKHGIKDASGNPIAAGQYDPTNPGIAAAPPAGTYVSGTPASTTLPQPVPPRPRRISIGSGLPWECEYDFSSTANPYTPGTTPKFLYWDRAVSPAVYSFYQQGTGPTAGMLVDSASTKPLPPTAVMMGDPQTKAVQAFLVVRPYGVMPGPPYFRPNIRIRVSHLEQLTVTFPSALPQSLGFPSSGEAVAVLNTGNDVSSTPEGGLTEAFLSPNYAGNNLPNMPNQGPPPWENDGTKPTVNYNYPFVGTSVPIPVNVVSQSNDAAYPSPYGGEDDPLLTNTTDAGSGVPPPPMQPIHLLADTNNNYMGATMQINGAELQIDVLDGVSAMNQAQVLQTVFVKIPPMVLPIPTVERANGQGGAEPHAIGGTNGNAMGGAYHIARVPGYTASSGTPPSLSYYWQMDIDPTGITSGIPGSGIANRFNTGDLQTIINRGDIVRSFVVNPVGPAAGDMRMLVANAIQPTPVSSGVNLSTDTFAPLGMERSQAYYDAFPTQGPSYGLTSTAGSPLHPNGFPQSLFIRQLHSLYTDTGRTYGPALLQTSLQILNGAGGILDDGVPFVGSNGLDLNQGAGIGESAGALIVEPNLASPPAVATENYSSQSAPVATPELQGAFMDPVSKSIPGDWTLGVGSNSDGGYVAKPDEGAQVPANGAGVEMGYSGPYYTTNGNLDFSTAGVSYIPNRQIASAVQFGTLPSQAIKGVPWCTLLFCPNPAANDNGSSSPLEVHPGFGVPQSGQPGPDEYPPYTTPPDHLLLDLFWMPIVEPYAISEPFSTAGKVNMNYEIVPFGSYITRSTALHAVMKSTRITAIASRFNDAGTQPASATSPEQNSFPHIKAIGTSRFTSPNSYGVPQYNYSIRYGINLQATIDDADSGFQVRFKQLKDIFRSASEICNVFLVPEKVPGSIYPPTTIAPAPPTDASSANMKTWWANYQMTGDNGRENPYNQIYPRLTTKSNTFQVHMRVQVLSQSPGDRGTGSFDTAAGDSVVGEYRGSAIVERYLDPNQANPALPDFATTFPNSPTSTVDNYIHYRVVSTQAFTP
jgi:hypothetical protein